MDEPVSKQPASRSRRAVVEQRKKRGRFFAGKRRRDFKIAPRRGIERGEFARRFDEQLPHMRKRSLLRRTCVNEEGTGCADREWHILPAKRGQIAGAELLRQRALGSTVIEMPRPQRARRRPHPPDSTPARLLG